MLAGAITVLFVAVSLTTAAPADRTFLRLIGAAARPLNLLLPVLGIVVITSEWTRRTAATSYTLMPVRRRVLLAQVYAVLITGLVAIALGVGLAALAALTGGNRAWAEFGVGTVACLALAQFISLLQGAAFGLLFLDLSAAILSYFAVPACINLLCSLWTPLAGAQPWFDLWVVRQRFVGAVPIGPEQWFHLATSTGLWVVLPVVVGVVRLHRVDIN